MLKHRSGSGNPADIVIWPLYRVPRRTRRCGVEWIPRRDRTKSFGGPHRSAQRRFPAGNLAFLRAGPGCWSKIGCALEALMQHIGVVLGAVLDKALPPRGLLLLALHSVHPRDIANAIVFLSMSVMAHLHQGESSESYLRRKTDSASRRLVDCKIRRQRSLKDENRHAGLGKH
jgi:hypothetical protein